MGVAARSPGRAWVGVFLPIVAALLCSLPSVSWAEDANDSGEVVHIKFAFSSNNVTERRLMQSQIDRFNSLHPRVQVRAVPRLWEGYGIFDSYVRFLALQDPSVDVYMVDNPWIPEFVQPGWLLPLDGRLQPGDLEQWADNAVRWGRYEGRLYGLPLNYKANMLFFRQDLLAKHGIAPPQTIDQLAKAARALQRDEQLPIGLGLHALYFYNDVFPFLYASRGDILKDGQLALAGASNKAALRALVALFEPASPKEPAVIPKALFLGEWSKEYGAPIEAFAKERAAFAVGWSRNYFELDAVGSAVHGKVGIAAIPGVRPGHGGSNFGSWYLVVSAASRHPAQSVEFIRYMLGPDVQHERLASLGDLPVRKDLLQDPKRSTAVARMLPILDIARPRPRVTNERAFDAVIERHLQAAVRGEETPGGALDAAQRELGPLMPRDVPAPTSAPETETFAPSGAASEARRLRILALVVGLLMLAFPRFLVWLRDRFHVPVLRRIRDKLFVFGVVLSGVLLAVSAGLMTGNAITDQDAEFTESRKFFHDQALRHATRTAKNLSLSASIVADFSPDAKDELGTSEMKQLMMASHFSEDLLLFEIWDKQGKRVLSQQDALYLDPSRQTDVYPPAKDLRARVLGRAIHVSERQSESGAAYIEAFAPIHRHGEHIGALRIGLSQARFSEQLQRIDQRHQDAIRRIASTGGVLALLLLAGATVASVVLSRRLATPIVELTEKAKSIRRGELDVEIVARSPDEIGTLASTMSEMVQGLRDRDFIREVLGRYVASEIVERFLADPSALALGGASRRVSILMSDLRGFTRLAAELGPERTIQLLNDYFAEMFEVIQRHRGLINEVRGDGILVVFGVPEPEGDDATRAIACAVEMQIAMQRFRERLRSTEVPDVVMGIGLHSGEVIAGNIGSAQRAKFGVVGDAVNLAARIEAFTVGGEILASADIVKAAGGSVRVGPQRQIRVKGRADEMAVRPVLGVGDAELPVEVDEPLVTLPSPGLDVELRVVESSRVTEQIIPARLVRYAKHGGELRSASGLEQGTEVVLRISTAESGRTGELFAKILDSEPDDDQAFRVRLRWTSVRPDDAKTLATLAGG